LKQPQGNKINDGGCQSVKRNRTEKRKSVD
jgi:hypothetical protein